MGCDLRQTKKSNKLNAFDYTFSKLYYFSISRLSFVFRQLFKKFTNTIFTKRDKKQQIKPNQNYQKKKKPKNYKNTLKLKNNYALLRRD